MRDVGIYVAAYRAVQPPGMQLHQYADDIQILSALLSVTVTSQQPYKPLSAA